jgi:enoyl-CoA hydratase
MRKQPAVILTKEAVNAAYETTLATGLQYERRMFASARSLSDSVEGMKAFAEKRAPKWQHK